MVNVAPWFLGLVTLILLLLGHWCLSEARRQGQVKTDPIADAIAAKHGAPTSDKEIFYIATGVFFTESIVLSGLGIWAVFSNVLSLEVPWVLIIIVGLVNVVYLAPLAYVFVERLIWKRSSS